MRDYESVASQRRALGEELAAYRRAAGYSQAALAALLYCSRSTVANVETGRQHVTRDFWKRADSAVNAGGRLIQGNDNLEAAARRIREEAARAASGAREVQTALREPRYLDDQPDHGSAWPEEMGEPHLAGRILWPDGRPPRVPPVDDVDPVLALRWLVAPRDGPAARRGGGRAVTFGDLERLRGVRHHLKDIDNAHGGGTALPMALSYVQRELPHLLDGQYDDATGRSLLAITAEFQHDIGWMGYDANRQALATYYFARALRFSHAAGNRLLGGRVLAAMSHQAIHLGRVRQAVDFARAARYGTLQVVTPRAAAMLAAMEACAHAAAGEARLCRAALDDSEQALARTPGRSEPDWLDFDEGGYFGHAARAYRDLGEVGKAAQLAERSVALCLAGHSRTRAQRAAIQATAYVELGEIDAAAQVGQKIVAVAWNLHSGHVFGEIAGLVRAVEPFKARAAAGFVEQARELLATRAAAS